MAELRSGAGLWTANANIGDAWTTTRLKWRDGTADHFERTYLEPMRKELTDMATESEELAMEMVRALLVAQQQA